MSASIPPATVVRDVIATADRRRRAERATRALAKGAPIGAAVILLIAVASRLVGWPLAVTLTLTAIAVVGAGVALWIARRPRPVTDLIAAAIDDDAKLAGELRSAYYFAAASAETTEKSLKGAPKEPVKQDDWTAFHLERAATRVSTVSWRDVYPPTSTGRAWTVTAALMVAAFLLPAGLPVWPSAPAAVSAATQNPELAAELELLPTDLQLQILDIMEALRTGKLTLEQALAALRELPAFQKLDKDLRDQIENSLQDVGQSTDESERTDATDAAPGQTTSDVQWARENMASRLAAEQAQKGEGGEPPKEIEQTPARGEHDQSGEKGEGSQAQASARVPAKEGMQTEGATGMALRNGETGDPGMAFGGKKGSVKYGTVDATELAAALKKEQIEAIANLDNSNLKNEDKRRKTERGWSALRYTRVSGPTSFDRARTEAPHIVPEARRPLLERYFVREAVPETPPAPSAQPPATRP